MYQALYRKWRPRVFEDVAGQPHITRTLKNELVAGRVAHAYLFTGSRGTGKTTCAKILAKAVNCLHPQNGDPCNECANCRGIDAGSILDVVEIDAASNNGVDNIRDLREEAGYTPASAKYRVYIIDEAHMLSQGAFNALLKTLEEPPAYVLFILATTEVHKIPATILSRCQRFDFRRIPVSDIAARLLYVAKEEGLRLTEGGAVLIARLSDGALRDGLSLLDRCAGAQTDINEEMVASIAGLAGRGYLFEFAEAVKDGDTARALRLLDSLYASAKDMERLCEELIEHFRGLLLAGADGLAPANSEAALPDDAQKVREQAAQFMPEALLHALDLLGGTLEALRRSPSRRVEMELCFMRMCSPSLDDTGASLLRRVAALEQQVRAGVPVSRPAAPAEEPPGAPVSEKAAGRHDRSALPESSFEETKLSDTADVLSPEPDVFGDADDGPLAAWPQVLQKLGASDPPLRGVLEGSSAVTRGHFVLVDSDNALFASLIRQQSHQKPLLEAVHAAAGKPYKVGIFKRSLAVRPSEEQADPMDEIIRTAGKAGIDITEK